MIDFVEVDAKKLYDDIIIQFQEALGEILYPGDERRIFLEQENQLIVSIYNAINDSAKQNLLRYARGEVLDAIGESKDTPRLQAQKATCTVTFTLSNIQLSDVLIPQGTRVTPDGTHFFQTIEDSIILAGTSDINVLTEATTTGTEHNSFTPGQVKTLVDAIAFIGSVTNTDESSGGAEIEADDDGINVWSGYRERIRLASSKLSTAGHELGYIYYAKSADTNIQDVVPTSPNPGEVLLTVLMKNGELPTSSILDKVIEVCTPKKVRPMTDNVAVAAPSVVNYDINLTYYIDQENESDESNIKDAITSAIEVYKEWQYAKLGRHINPDKLRQEILNAGAIRVDLTSPIYTVLTDVEVAKIGTSTVNYGGLE